MTTEAGADRTATVLPELAIDGDPDVRDRRRDRDPGLPGRPPRPGQGAARRVKDIFVNILTTPGWCSGTSPTGRARRRWCARSRCGSACPATPATQLTFSGRGDVARPGVRGGGHRPVQPRRSRHGRRSTLGEGARDLRGGGDRRDRRHRVLEGLGPQRAAAGRRGGAGRAGRCRAGARRRRRAGDVHDGHHHRDRAGPRARHRRAEVLQPDPLRRRRGLRDRPAGGDGGRHRGRASAWCATGRFNERSGRRFGQVPAPRCRRLRRGGQRSHYPMGLSTPAATGGDDRPALHARLRRDQRGLRRGSRSPTASTPPPTRRPGSTSSRSPSRSTRRRGGSPSRCGCWTAARRPTAPWPWS